MKNLKLKPLNLLYNITVFAVLFAIMQVNVLYALPAGFVSGVVLGFCKSKAVALFMAVQVEIWEKDIESNLKQDNTFLSTFKQAEKANINGRTVHIPQAGKGGNVAKNRTQLPAEVKRRTDTVVSYQINEFTSDPMLITNAEDAELSYDKRSDVLEDERRNLAEDVAEDVLQSIVHAQVGVNTDLPASSIIVTSGADVQATALDATGTRKAYALKDLQTARTFFIKQKMWTEGRMFALISAEAAAQIFPADSLIAATYMASVSEAERRAGVMYKAYGFNIMVRSTVYTLTGAGAFKPFGAEGAATDCEGIVFYNGNAVEFAMGDVEFFANEKEATFYGDVYSFLVRCGARARRANYEGILVIKQAA